MDKNIFPELIEIASQFDWSSYGKKSILYERLFYQYLKRKMEGWSVKDFLKNEKIEKYALYAITDLTELFIKDIEKNDGSKPKIICDKNAKNLCYMGERTDYKVFLPDEMICMYKNGKLQKIIVMSVLHENEIVDELLKKGIQLRDLISVVSILYS